MKNKYMINGDETIIYTTTSSGEILEVLIDTKDLEKVDSFPNTWSVVNSKGKYIIRGTFREDGKKKQILLKQFILREQLKEGEKIIYNLNGDGLDNRRKNLATNLENEKLKQTNKYEINDEIATLYLNRRGKESLKALIDKDDLEKVLSYGTWFSEYHQDLKGETVQNVSYTYEEGKKKRRKVSIQNVILDNYDGHIIKHKNGNRLDNRKENLIRYKDEITNTYKIENEITKISLNYKNELYETIIDTEDLERVKKLGYTLSINVEGLPYCFSRKNGKIMYLHRFIMNLSEGDNRVVDHINHNTLDNRKSNLNVVTINENQQNRLGTRKGSKSGVRGVSWDSRNKDWIVNVKGQYFGRTKDKEEAEKLAKEKIEELMPYTLEIKLD